MCMVDSYSWRFSYSCCSVYDLWEMARYIYEVKKVVKIIAMVRKCVIVSETYLAAAGAHE